MTPRSFDSSSLRSLKKAVGELIEPLKSTQTQAPGTVEDRRSSALGLLMGELTMVALLFTYTDSTIARDELDLLNNILRAVYGDEAPLLETDDYVELCREFLTTYPERRLSIDHVPHTVNYLEAYDREHNTDYADKARGLFFEFARAIVQADEIQQPVEYMTLMNFKDILYPPANPE